MAIKHVKHLEAHCKVSCSDLNKCELKANEDEILKEKRAEFKHGFREATFEVMRFLVEVKGLYPEDALCLGLAAHLREHLAKITPENVNHKTNQLLNPSGSTEPTTPTVASPMPVSDKTLSFSNSTTSYMSTESLMVNRQVRERSASISSYTSDANSRPASTPTPLTTTNFLGNLMIHPEFGVQNGVKGMELDSPETASLSSDRLASKFAPSSNPLPTSTSPPHNYSGNSNQTGSNHHHPSSPATTFHLRDILKNYESENECRPESRLERVPEGDTRIVLGNGCGNGQGSDSSCSTWSSNTVCNRKPDTTASTTNDDSNGSRPTSRSSPSSESYRFFKKGIKERFQMESLYNQKIASDLSGSSDTNSTLSLPTNINEMHSDIRIIVLCKCI